MRMASSTGSSSISWSSSMGVFSVTAAAWMCIMPSKASAATCAPLVSMIRVVSFLSLGWLPLL